MVKFCTLFSSSAGNTVYLGTDKGSVLIDCGMSGKQIFEAMESLRLVTADVRAILITHEHSDHVKGAGILARKLDVPVYATEGTWDGMDKVIGNIKPYNRVTINAGESFFLEDLEIAPFSISHDANDPVGYRIFTPKASVAIATDMGYFSETAENALLGTDIVLLESNHDPEMLRLNPHYSQHLKARILGRKGHLCNDASAQAAVKLAHSGTKHILLGHLSKENNTIDLALNTVKNHLTQAGLSERVTVHVAGRNCPSVLYTIA